MQLRIAAAGGIIVDIEQKKGEKLQDSIDRLVAKNPDLAYMQELKNNPNVDWNRINAAYQSWDYGSQGLTQAGAAIIAIAVAIATMGAGLAAAAGTMAAGMATSMGASLAVSGMVSTAAGAAFTSLVSQATVSLVNNQGDLGETFRDMGESQVWQNVAFAAVTAGAMDYAGGATTSFSNNAFGTMPLTPAEFTAASRAVNVVANSTISAAAQSAIYGDNFSETFTDRLITNSVYAVGAGVAGEIGETYVNANRGAGSGELVLNYALHKVAHAGLGCAMGAATSDNCAAGAAGAVAGEIAAETYIKLKLNGGAISLNEIRQIKETGGHLATLAGAGTAFVLGADAEGVYTGANTGANAAENNALDTITDALTVLYDMGKIGYGLYVDDDGVVKEGFVDLAADGVALLIPMVPAGSTKIARLAGKADNVADGVKGGEKFVEGVNGAFNKIEKAGSSGGDTAGMKFTQKDKIRGTEESKAANNGVVKCNNCGVETVPGQKSQKGVTPPSNETQHDHVIPRTKGGNRSPENQQILCRDCNRQKSDK